MKSIVVKRSVVIDGHKTSVSLEDAFWSDLKEIAHMQRATLSKVIAEIDKGRRQGNNACSYSTKSGLEGASAAEWTNKILSFSSPRPPSLFEIRHRLFASALGLPRRKRKQAA